MVNRMEQQSVATEQVSHQPRQPKVQSEMPGIHTEPDSDMQLSKKDALKMVDSMNKFLKTTDSQLKFVLHDQLNEYYVTIVNPETDEIIREIPSKKLMDIHAAMKEFVGLLVDRKI